MPKQVKLAKNREFHFSAPKKGGASKYDWDAWFNGDLLLLERDNLNTDGTVAKKQDFNAEVNLMVPKIKLAARTKYKFVQISRVDADGNKLKDSLIIRARDMTPDEKVAEDIKRAEEKEAKKVAAATKATEPAAPTMPPSDPPALANVG